MTRKKFTLRSGNKPSGFKAMGSSPAKSITDKLQTGLSVAGMLPIVGNLADLANTAVSAGRAGYAKYSGDEASAKKHLANMAINAAAAIPGAGQAVTGAKLAAQGGKALVKAAVKEGGKGIAKGTAKKAVKKTAVGGAKKGASDAIDTAEKRKNTISMKGGTKTRKDIT